MNPVFAAKVGMWFELWHQVWSRQPKALKSNVSSQKVLKLTVKQAGMAKKKKLPEMTTKMGEGPQKDSKRLRVHSSKRPSTIKRLSQAFVGWLQRCNTIILCLFVQAPEILLDGWCCATALGCGRHHACGSIVAKRIKRKDTVWISAGKGQATNLPPAKKQGLNDLNQSIYIRWLISI